MQTRIELTISDDLWPKLKLTGLVTLPSGEKRAFEGKQQYDTAYLQFENTVHNQLRPAISSLIERRRQDANH